MPRGYTREQRAAKAAAQATAAAKAIPASEGPGMEAPSEALEPSSGDVIVRPQKERPMSERNQMMEEIAARNLERAGVTAPSDDDPAPEPKAEPKANPKAEPKAVPEQAAAQPAETAALEAPKTAKQIVDGREYEVALSEIEEAGGERAWRKDRAASNRLEEAKAALAESKRTQAAIVQWAQSQVPQQQQVSQEQLLQQHMELIRNGTPEQSAAALRAVIQSNVQQVNPIEIQNTAVFKMRQDQAATQFKAEFPEIAANPTLMEFAGVKENAALPRALQSLGITSMADPRVPHFDFGQFYRSIGNEIRSAFPRQSQQQAAEEVTTPGIPSQKSEREERKSSIVNLPTAAARAETPAEPKAETREEILNSMRKARGLPTG